MSPADPLFAAGEEPVFTEPWQAQAFALAVHLQDAGAFSAGEWAQALGAEIHAEAAGGAVGSEACYERWLAALERLALERGLIAADALSERTLAWADAYRSTPHGSSVELAPSVRSGG